MKDQTKHDEQLSKLFQIIKDIDFGMLVTQTSDGSLRSRPMSTRIIESDKCLWFLTDKGSAKLLEITSESKVNVSFANPSEQTYASVSGIATITDDRDKLDEVWSPDAKLWFPEGKSDPRLIMIRVQPMIAEYWDAPQGVFVNLYNLTQALISGDRPENEYAEHEKVNFS